MEDKVKESSFCKIISDKGELEADFVLFQLHNGNIIIEATTNWEIYPLIGKYGPIFQTLSATEKSYRLEGQTTDGLSFEIDQANAISWNKFSVNQQGPDPRCCSKWIFGIEAGEHLYLRCPQEKPNEVGRFDFALTNIVETPNFTLDWSQKNCTLSLCTSSSDDQYEMMTQQIPMATGFLVIKSLDNSLCFEKAKRIAQDISYLLSLAEGHLVSNPYAKVLDEQEKIYGIHVWECRMGQPNPGFNTIGRKDIGSFISSVFPSFHAKSPDEKDHLGITFEYYINAKESQILEYNFSNGFTVLERLTSSYRGVGKPELATITKETRKKIRRDLSKIIDDSKEQNLIDMEASKTLNKRIDNIFDRQPTFREMLEKFLTEYDIEYDDLMPDNIESLQDYSRYINGLRNDIVHSGKTDDTDIIETLENFITLLDRSIFAVLDYDLE